LAIISGVGGVVAQAVNASPQNPIASARKTRISCDQPPDGVVFGFFTVSVQGCRPFKVLVFGRTLSI